MDQNDFIGYQIFFNKHILDSKAHLFRLDAKISYIDLIS